MAVFIIVVNNADRWGGHVLAGTDGRVYGVDHGVSLHAHDKLRTVLWGWAGSRSATRDVAALADLDTDWRTTRHPFAHPHHRGRTGRLATAHPRPLDDPVMPSPDGRRPLPWPAF